MDSNQETYKNYFQNNQSSEDKDLLEEIDFSKIILVLKKSLIWITLFFALGISSSILYLRYTAPIYQSVSTIKVKQENEAQEVNIVNSRNSGSGGNDLEGEIELIKSKILFDKVIDQLNLHVSYFADGRILDEEKFPKSEFEIRNYEIKNSSLYNLKINILLLNEKQAQVSYEKGGQIFEKKFNIYERYEGSDISFDIIFNSLNQNIDRNLYFIINSKSSLYSYISNNLSVYPNNNSETIKISFTDNNKHKAQKIVDKIDSLYLNFTLEEKKKRDEQSIAYIESQLEKTGQQLSSSEKEWEIFSENHKTIGIAQDQNYYLSIYKNTNIEIRNSKYYIENINKIKNNVISDSLSVNIPLVSYINDQRLTVLSDHLIEANNAVSKMKKLSGEKSTVVKLKQREYSEIKNKTIVVLNDLYESEKELLKDLEKQLATINEKVNELPKKATLELQIDRQFRLYEKFYSMLQEKKLEYEIKKAGIVQDFKILSPANLPTTPISPVRTMIYVYGVVLAITLSLLLVVLRYVLHTALITQQDFQNLTKVPILGVVPKHKKKMEVSQLVVHHNPKASISEAFRSLRTNLEFLSSTDGKKIFSVTSTISGEGKTFISTNLSAIIALSGKKVVLLDLDMRKPKVHLAFGMDNNQGMSTLLIGKSSIQDAVQKTEVEGLDFISAGPIPPNPSELILREAFDNLLVDLHKTYDIIIIDTPPTGLVTDGVLIMKKVDVPLYVARSEYTKKGFEKNLNGLYSQKEFSKLAVIINGMSKVGSYGYGYGYGYGNYYEEEPETSLLKRVFKKS